MLAGHGVLDRVPGSRQKLDQALGKKGIIFDDEHAHDRSPVNASPQRHRATRSESYAEELAISWRDVLVWFENPDRHSKRPQARRRPSFLRSSPPASPSPP